MYSAFRCVVRGAIAGTVLTVVLVATAGTATAASACTIVQNPTDVNHTSCPGADLEGANLSNLDLDYADFHGANLTGANLSNSSLHLASLADTQLASANLRYADLSVADLIGADASTGATLSYANLTSADLWNFQFVDGSAQHAIFDGAFMSGSSLSGTVLTGASFSRTVVMPAVPRVEAASESGAEVSYAASSESAVPGVALTTCSPGPGFFPVGYNAVTCGVVDDYGNSGTGTTVAIVGLPSVLTTQPALVSASGNVLSMTVRLTDGISGSPVAGGMIWFWVSSGRAPICWSHTDSNGIATCQVNDPNTAATVVASGGYTAYYYGFDTPKPYFDSHGSAGVVG